MTRQNLNVIIGAGALGSAVAQELIARGSTVRIVNRSGKAQVPAEVEIYRCDASDPQQISAACQGAAVVYHCAVAPYTQWPALLPPLMEGIIAGTAAAGAKLIYGDNLYMYGPVKGPISETSPPTATTRKGRARAKVAAMLLEAHERGIVRASIGRASNFYGPGVRDSLMGEGVFKAALQGKAAPLIGKPDKPHTFSYITDVARALITLGERDEALGQIWHIPNAPTVTTREFVNQIFSATGTTPRFNVAPTLILNIMALFNPMMNEVKEMLYEFEESFIVDHSKFAATFGAAPTPIVDGIHETLGWYQAQLQVPATASS